jgi:hypothetical protein
MHSNYFASVQPNLKCFYAFAKMNNHEKTTLLNHSGILLDKDLEKENSVNLYYLNGFFVEEIRTKNKVVDIIPYKQGYRLESYAEIRQAIVPKRTDLKH